MYYSYVEIEYVAMNFSPARTDLAVKLLSIGLGKAKYSDLSDWYFRVNDYTHWVMQLAQY